MHGSGNTSRFGLYFTTHFSRYAFAFRTRNGLVYDRCCDHAPDDMLPDIMKYRYQYWDDGN